jgi:hypothetical protein
LFVLAHSASRRLTEAGLVLCLVGAVVLAVTAMRGSRMYGRVAGGALLAFGLMLLLVAVHFGVSPFRNSGTTPTP